MYRAFNLKVSNSQDFLDESGQDIDNQPRNEIMKSLEGFIKNGILNGSNLGSHWFPEIASDVFISHSHRDKEYAISCASWLYKNFGLVSFIDSCVWGYADDLLKIIDDKYCYNSERKTYNYRKRNQSTSHVHMMLTTALSEMLKASECVLFINSPNSITSDDAVNKTQSPWLFLELGIMRIIRREKPKRLIEEATLAKGGELLAIEYQAPLSELTPLSVEQLSYWLSLSQQRIVNSRRNNLDLLYEIAPESREPYEF